MHLVQFHLGRHENMVEDSGENVREGNMQVRTIKVVYKCMGELIKVEYTEGG